MTVYDSFAKQVLHGKGIEERHIRAFNELLDPGGDPENRLALRGLQFSALSDAATQRDALVLPGFDSSKAEFKRSEMLLQALYDKTTECESALSSLTESLASKLGSQELMENPEEDGHVTLAWSHYCYWQSVVSTLKFKLERRSLCFEAAQEQAVAASQGDSAEAQPSLFAIPDLYYDLAESVMKLIRTQDEVYQRGLLKTANRDYEARSKWREEIYESLEKLNGYLEDTRADFRLDLSSGSLKEDLIVRRSVMGVPCEPLFERVFGPFFDFYLSLPCRARKLQLAVCCECFCLFRRSSSRDHRSTRCVPCRSGTRRLRDD